MNKFERGLRERAAKALGTTTRGIMFIPPSGDFHLWTVRARAYGGPCGSGLIIEDAVLDLERAVEHRQGTEP
jgi:hypothetical protein